MIYERFKRGNMRILVIIPALTDIQIRSATIAKTPRKRLRDDKHGKHNARCRIAQCAQSAVPYKNLIHNIIERTNEQ